VKGKEPMSSNRQRRFAFLVEIYAALPEVRRSTLAARWQSRGMSSDELHAIAAAASKAKSLGASAPPDRPKRVRH
jgi:hypothetical protein